MRQIHIALATDCHYVKQCAIVVESVMQHSNKAAQYVFHILTDGIQNELNIESEIGMRYANAMVERTDVTGKVRDAIWVCHISPMTCARLLLPELLSDVSRCIYLDCDLIVEKDIEDLFFMDMEDKTIWGVKAPGYHVKGKEERESYRKKVGLPGLDQYINAGVLLMDLKKMRRQDFTNRALSLIEEHYPSQDQDIINKLCYGDIGFLPAKYNLMTNSLRMDKDELERFHVYTSYEIDESRNDPVVIHYAHAVKPWDFPESAMADHWWKACERTEWFGEFVRRSSKSFYFEYKNNKDKIWGLPVFSKEWIQYVKEENLYVYGNGKIGRALVDKLKEEDVTIQGILVTSEKNLTERVYDQISVMICDEKIPQNALVFVAASLQYHKEIRDNLYRYGVGRILYFL